MPFELPTVPEFAESFIEQLPDGNWFNIVLWKEPEDPATPYACFYEDREPQASVTSSTIKEWIAMSAMEVLIIYEALKDGRLEELGLGDNKEESDAN